MEASPLQDEVVPIIEKAQGLLHGLSKFESTMSPEHKKLVQKTVESADSNLASAKCWVPHSGTAAYLSTGAMQSLANTAASMHKQLQALLSGGVALPRSSKEDLSSAAKQLADVKPLVDIPEDRAKVEGQLVELYACGVEKRMDPDVIESKLDEITQQILMEMYGESRLDEEDLSREMEWLLEAVDNFGQRGNWIVYSLTLNSLERLHAVQAKPGGGASTAGQSVVSDLSEDDEDLFSMPVPIGALELAKRFEMLAEPISRPTADGAAKPMLEMNDGKLVEEDRPTLMVPGLTAADYEEVPLSATSTSQQPLETQEQNDGQKEQQSQSQSQAELQGEQKGGEVDVMGPANAEKALQLTRFLQGENTGACTFHAQMRLSPEGCYKLAKFLEKSGRIKALSLSANFLGDKGILIVCSGLRKNKTVAAIDFPNNDITDESAVAIAEAVSHNTLITTLELGANRITDKGAIAIAKVLKTNPCLKKVGLAMNQIGPEGCAALAEAARQNAGIKQIQILPGNLITEKDAKGLAKAIQKNKSNYSIRRLFGMGKKGHYHQQHVAQQQALQQSASFNDGTPKK